MQNVRAIYNCVNTTVSVTWNCTGKGVSNSGPGTSNHNPNTPCGYYPFTYANCTIVGILWDNGTYTGGPNGIPTSGGGSDGIPYYVVLGIPVISTALFFSSCARGISPYEAANGKAKCGRYVRYNFTSLLT